jgi:Carboxypeptidase regulatory-like domain/TonB dependent receptor/TonB-dependent Receptor Plug Domain
MKIEGSERRIVSTRPMRNDLANKKGTPLLAVVLVALLLILGISTGLKAQAVGATLTGTITDPSGGVVANATITITNTATGVPRSVSTNDSGLYSAPNLQPGDYQVTATAAGFATESTKLTLTVGAQQTLSLSLKVGASTQTVEIDAAPPNINLVESTLGGLNEEAQIKELPLNGRSWSDLANLAPGVYSIHEQPATSSRDRYTRGFGQELSISGNRPQQNNYRLDGISIMDAEQGAPGSLLGGNLGVDAIAEFSVLTTNYSTEYGRAAGGVINATTKSGTNQFHGNAYEFLRNSALDGRNFFDGPNVPAFRRNQFGGSAGGPIKKDKVFIFGDYEGLRQVLNATQSSPVPTAAARQGILTGGTPLPVGSACPAGSTIPVPGQSTVCVDTQAARFLSTFFPLPNAGISGDTGNFAFGRPTQVSENYFIIRSDQTMSEKNSFHETYMFDRSASSEVDELRNKNVNSKIHRQVLVLDESHSVSPTFLLDTRFGISRIWSGAPFNGSAVNPAAADPSFATVPGTQGPAQIFITGLVQFSGGLSTTSPQRDGWTAWQGYEDAFITRGIHSIKFGGGFEWDKWNRFYTPRAGGQWNFGSLSDFLQNLPTGTSLTADTAGDPTQCPFPQYSCLFPRGQRQTIFGLYIQDDIKVRPNFTLNIGLRYEPTTVPAEVHGQVAGLTTVTAIPEPGKGQHVGNPLYTNNTLKNFSPRVGFAWDPFSTGKTSVRGGFGFYDAQSYLNFFNNPFSSSAPFYDSIGISNLAQGDFPNKAFAKGFATLTTGLPCKVTTSLGCSTGTLLYPDGGLSIDATTRAAYVQQRPGRSYVMQYNLSLQRELTPSLALLVGYVGSHGVHGAHVGDDLNIVAPSLYVGRLPVWSCEPFVPAGATPPAGEKVGCNGIGLGEPVGYNLNTATGGPIGGQFARLNPFVGREAISGYRNSSLYDGLEVQLTKRMSHGFQVTGSFTYQRSIDESSGNQAGDEFLNEISSTPTTLPSYLTRAASSFNVPKVLAINYLWQVPTRQSATGMEKNLLGGWQFGGIFTASNGTPFSIALAQNDSTGWNSTDPWAYPDRLRTPDCASIVNRSDYLHYVKTQCFIAPAAVVATDPVSGLPAHFIPYGNAGRNEIPGPNLWNLDFSLVKNTPVKRISETFNVQFRVEAFNVFNHTNFNSPIDNQFIIDPTISGIGIVPANRAANVTSNAGAIDQTSTTSRQMQFALKLIW